MTYRCGDSAPPRAPEKVAPKTEPRSLGGAFVWVEDVLHLDHESGRFRLLSGPWIPSQLARETTVHDGHAVNGFQFVRDNMHTNRPLAIRMAQHVNHMLKEREAMNAALVSIARSAS